MIGTKRSRLVSAAFLTVPVAAWMLLSLSGCNSAESTDKTPPDPILNLAKSQGKYRFGITDTIVIDFTEKIDTAALALDFTPPEGIDHRFASAARLLIFGKNRLYGVNYFNINSPFTLGISGLRDLHGNGQALIEESFRPYAWVDGDFLDSNFHGYDSLYASDSTWADGSSMADSLITEGSLDFKKIGGSAPDYIDIKVAKISGGDTLLATLTTVKDVDLNLKVAGPFSKAGLDSLLIADNLDTSIANVQTSTRGSASVKIPADLADFKRKFKDPNALGLYAFFIEIPQGEEGFYRLGISIHKFK